MSVRITDLPEATELNGSELMPIVQNGVTRRTTLDFVNQAAPAALILQQTQQVLADTQQVLADTQRVKADTDQVLVNTEGVYNQTVMVQGQVEISIADWETQYLGAKSDPPTTDNEGNPLHIGTLYWDTSLNAMFVWSGTSWTAFSSAVASVNGQIGEVVLDYTTPAEAAAAAPVQSVAGRTGAVSLTNADVGLANVDNTSDLNKPVSTATQNALNLKLNSNDPSVTNAREWTAQTVSQVEAEAGMATTRRAWTAERVFQAIAAWWNASAFKTKLDGIQAGAQVNTVNSVAGKIGIVTLVKEDVGLANVDNTSDLNKPVSTAQAAAIAASSNFQQAGAGAVVRTSQDKMREWVSVKDFGAVGDGVANDTAEIQAALAYLTSVGGGKLTFGKDETYLVTDELSVTDSVEVDLNGSTINFAAIGGKRLLSIQGSNVQVRNGTVNNTLNQVGFEGTLQTPIVIGKYTQLAGYANVVLENLTVSTEVNQGNGIAIFGDSHDIVVQNITFPDSDKIGIPVLAHWSFDGGPTGPYLGSTTHPHNITINNIRCGDLTYNAGAGTLGTSVVFLSAVYNVSVSNIYVKSIPYGKIVSVYAGDWGFQFGTATEQALGSTGITVSNLYGQALVGLETYMRNTLESPSVIWPASISLKNMSVLGYGATSSSSKGINIDVTDNVSVEDCVIRNAYVGVQIGSGTNVKIRNSIIKNNAREGLVKIGTGGSSNVKISDCRFEGNNMDNVANMPDIRLVSMSQVSVFGNVFNSPNVAWNLRAENTVTGLRVSDNHVVNVKLANGPCFSFGNQPDTNICIEFEGNTSAVSPAGGIRGGQFMVPMVLSARYNQNTLQRVAYYSAVPDRGTWAVGDRVFNDNPVIGQPKSWVCTVAGTPGTWMSEGNL